MHVRAFLYCKGDPIVLDGPCLKHLTFTGKGRPGQIKPVVVSVFVYIEVGQRLTP